MKIEPKQLYCLESTADMKDDLLLLVIDSCMPKLMYESLLLVLVRKVARKTVALLITGRPFQYR